MNTYLTVNDKYNATEGKIEVEVELKVKKGNALNLSLNLNLGLTLNLNDMLSLICLSPWLQSSGQ